VWLYPIYAWEDLKNIRDSVDDSLIAPTLKRDIKLYLATDTPADD